jgi:TPR repeat protein
MGKTVVSAFQMRNTIERLVESKVIAGPEADRWKRANEDFKALSSEFRQTVVKAHQGDVKAMRDIGVAYREGVQGVKEDYKEAHKWFFKASMQDEVAATTNRAVMLTGEGKDKDVLAAIEMTRAAMLGSEHACGCLALWFNNKVRVDRCTRQEHYWYKRMRKATCLNSCESYKTACDEHFKAWHDGSDGEEH